MNRQRLEDQTALSLSGRVAVGVVSVAVVAGALSLIATRSATLALDFGPNVAGWLWCF